MLPGSCRPYLRGACDVDRPHRLSAVQADDHDARACRFLHPVGRGDRVGSGHDPLRSHLLALTVWLKSYQRLGYFPKLDEVPQVVVEHVREALGLPADVVAEVGATRTAKRHREFVRTRLGVKYNAAKARILAEEAIRAAAQTKPRPWTSSSPTSSQRPDLQRHQTKINSWRVSSLPLLDP